MSLNTDCTCCPSHSLQRHGQQHTAHDLNTMQSSTMRLLTGIILFHRAYRSSHLPPEFLFCLACLHYSYKQPCTLHKEAMKRRQITRKFKGHGKHPLIFFPDSKFKDHSLLIESVSSLSLFPRFLCKHRALPTALADACHQMHCLSWARQAED